jgi:prepilin-type N-terminal cleavage/methylation domain-containing protein
MFAIERHTEMLKSYHQIQKRRSAGELDESGFTLIELLIVIVVLGILAAVVVFALGGVTSTSAQAACNSDAKNVETAVEAYRAQTGAYPTTAIVGTASPSTGQSQLVPTYLRTWPSANAAHYTVSVVAATGEVDVTPASGTVQNYDLQTAAATSPSTVAATGCYAVH